MIDKKLIKPLIVLFVVFCIGSPALAERTYYSPELIERMLNLREDVIVENDGLIYGLEGKARGQVVGYVMFDARMRPIGSKTCRCNGDGGASTCADSDCNVATCSGTVYYCRWYDDRE